MLFYCAIGAFIILINAAIGALIGKCIAYQDGDHEHDAMPYDWTSKPHPD